ncbi:hypothetical protein K1T35_48235 (plasmid) [Pseudonocardia sp. DSM 110487]|uniref:hypothetical protein n=1 Tax=Pseudonocardia sp. DSM 110487 TaxID=2865833 RepID=UPI001C696674|nr:hypothetical protein [Pseudonocardia sp. DSM 110487]QYN41138.1 hypothetical protein K1T35_48235 [Pseudonocardia sp. DSM 110487]
MSGGTPPLVALICSNPEMAVRLIEDHRDDGTGHCRSCSSGAQTGHYTFPCNILLDAQDAIRRLGEIEAARRRKVTPEPVVPV